MEMNIQDYIQERVDPQIGWYDSKSGYNKRCYRVLTILEIVLAAFIPLLVTQIENVPEGGMLGIPFINSLFLQFIVGFFGVLVVIFTGVLALGKYQEKWIKYRTTAEMLKHNKFLFLTATGQYDGYEPDKLFVQTIERLISEENSDWKSELTSSKSNEEAGFQFN